MRRFACLHFVSACLLAVSAQAESLVFISLSETRSYGLLVTAPGAGCRTVRYVLRGPAGVLGRTPPLAPGELAVVRVGRGYAPGAHRLAIEPQGCGLAPARVQRIAVAKPSPDHGWRRAPDLVPLARVRPER